MTDTQHDDAGIVAQLRELEIDMVLDGNMRGVARAGADRITQLEGENARLRGALEPWAKAAAVLDMPGAAESTGDGQPFQGDEVLWAGETGYLTVADFRRARAALNDKGSDNG